jgi:hypothetical protein
MDLPMSANAMHSDASMDWGTPILGRELAIRVLAPAARTAHAIDLDYASSAYWNAQWPTACGGGYKHKKYLQPYTFLNGTKGRNVLVEKDRRRTMARCEETLGACGSAFFNPPGLDGGEMVKKCWDLMIVDYLDGWLGSSVWVGFSLEQLASLQSVRPDSWPYRVDGRFQGGSHPLSKDFITIIPSRRGRYLLHPEVAIALLQKKQKKMLHAVDRRLNVVKPGKSAAYAALARRIKNIRASIAAGNLSPVQGDAPTHASYITILPSMITGVRNEQIAALKQFLAEQSSMEGSWFQRVAVVGDIG